MSELARVTLEAVTARDQAGPKGAARGAITNLSLELPEGVTVVLGAPEDGSLALTELLTGERRAERGRLHIAGGDPHHTPALRARVGALGVVPALPHLTDVASSLALATSGWSTPVAPAVVLETLGLGALSTRRASSLTRGEERALELALALSLPNPALLVLHEPLCDVEGPSSEAIVQRIEEAARRTRVLIVTSYPGDARRFGRVWLLHRGQLVRESASGHADLGPKVGSHRALWVGAGARSLVAALAGCADVASLTLDVGDDATGESGVVRVSGPHPDALALAIADAVVSSGCALRGMSELAPALSEVRAATEWELRSRALAAEIARTGEASARAQLAAMMQGAPRPVAPAYGVGAATPTPAPVATASVPSSLPAASTPASSSSQGASPPPTAAPAPTDPSTPPAVTSEPGTPRDGGGEA